MADIFNNHARLLVSSKPNEFFLGIYHYVFLQGGNSLVKK